MTHTPSKRSFVITENKFCRKCSVWKKRDDFKNDKNRKDGKYPVCKECSNSANVKISLENNFCKACGITHAIEDFSFDKRSIDGRQASCRRSRDKYYHNNREKSIKLAKRRHEENYSKLEYRAKHLFTGARTRARARNMEFSMLYEQIYFALIMGICQKSGIRFDLSLSSETSRNPFAPSVDRINSKKGYTNDNVQIVCNFYNAGKSDACEIDFIAMCMAVAEQNRDNQKAINRLKELRNAEF